MVKLTMIARVTDGLPLAEGLDDARDQKDVDFYKQQAKLLFKNLSRGHNEASKMSIETGPNFFHYIIEGRVCYLTMCDRSYPRKLVFQYLEDLKNEFEKINGDQIETAARPYAFIKFDTFIQKTKKLYLDTHTQRNLAKLNDELYEVHQIMTRNVQEVLGVGQKLDRTSVETHTIKDVFDFVSSDVADMAEPSGLGGINNEVHVTKDTTFDLVSSDMADRVEPSQLGGTVVEVFSIEDTTPGLVSSGVVVHSKLEDISSLCEGNMTSVDSPSLIVTLEPHKTSNRSKFGLEILHLFCQNLANEKPSSVQSFTTRANSVLTTAWVEGAQLDHYTALFRDIEKSLIQLEKVPGERAAHDARVAMEEASLFSLRQDLAKMRDDIAALTEKADEFATEIVRQVSEMSSRLTSESRIYADKAKDLNRQALIRKWAPVAIVLGIVFLLFWVKNKI